MNAEEKWTNRQQEETAKFLIGELGSEIEINIRERHKDKSDNCRFNL